MGLSARWRAVLTKLETYGDSGIDKDGFIELMGGSCKHILAEMFFTQNTGYFEHIEFTKLIRITDAGREALRDG